MLGVVENLQSFFERAAQIGFFAEFHLTAFLSIFTKLVQLAPDGRCLLHLAPPLALFVFLLFTLLNAVFVKLHLVIANLEFGFTRLAHRIDHLVAFNLIFSVIILHFTEMRLVRQCVGLIFLARAN